VKIDWQAENRERLEALEPFLKDLAIKTALRLSAISLRFPTSRNR